MRKRLLSLALALVLCLGLTAPAAAATVTEPDPSINYGKFRAFSEGLAAVYDNSDYGGWGYMDTTGKIVIPCQYHTLEPEALMDFSDGVVWAEVVYNETIQCLDKTGNVLFTLPSEYRKGQTFIDIQLGSFSEGLAWVQKEGKRGYIDKTGKEVIPCQYGDVKSFSEGLAAVYNSADGYWGYIDKTGNTVLPFQYQTAESFGERYTGYAMVKLMDGKETLIDKTGRDVIPSGYSYDIDKNSGWESGDRYVPLVSDDYNRDSVYDLTTGQIVQFPFYVVSDFHEGFARASTGSGDLHGGWLINENYEVITSQIYMDFVDFSGGYAMGSREIVEEGQGREVWFVIDSAGNEILRPDRNYDSIFVGAYAEGLIAVRTAGNYRYGFIDTTGREVVPCKYKSVEQFHNGVAPVQNFEDNWGLVDTSGNEIVPCQYRLSIRYVGGDGLWSVNLGGGGIGYSDHKLLRVSGTAPYSTAAPSTPSTPAKPAGPSANPTNSKVLVNGKEVAFDAYTIDGSNYFKLRDLAFVLNGTEKQFEVGWDNASKTITLTSGSAYTANGSEMAKGGGAQSASVSASKLLIDGKEVSLTAYTIGGNNYFKLRDIGQAFDFGIGWDNASKTITIDTSAGYTA